MDKKNIMNSMAAKTAAFLIVILSSVFLAVALCGTLYLAGHGFYTRSLHTIKESELESKAMESSLTVMRDVLIVRDTDKAQRLSDQTNATYEIRDDAQKLLWSNHTKDIENEYIFSYEKKYYEAKDYSSLSETAYTIKETSFGGEDQVSVFTVTAFINSAFPIDDELAQVNAFYDQIYSLRYALIVIAILLLILLAVSFVFLMCSAGHRRNHTEIVSGWTNRIPFEFVLVPLTAAILYIFFTVTRMADLTAEGLIILGTAAAVISFLGTALCMNFAVRTKLSAWWKNTLVFQLLHLLRNFFKALPVVWKTALCFLGLCLVELFFIGGIGLSAGAFAFGWFVEKLLLGGAAVCLAFTMRSLKKGGEALAGGNLSYQVDTKNMIWDLKEHGENLNSIGAVMSQAIEERMKSERMKAELVTNVSHDIKTPLTSIINYSDLISKESCENENIREYAAVLLKQSERLKKMLENLIEASKASTGNIEVSLASCDAGVILTQAAGEYEGRMNAAGLSLIAKQPEKSVRIMADGRLLWRVFDNLLNNICKYAQGGTRVYITLEEKDGDAFISFKNTSKYPLDITAEELTERFVRGDKSRSTEGSGLGLSIAKNLTELQGGTFHLSIDGDLFKATLKFTIIV